MKDFEFKPFEEMTPEDYATVGFKSGLEVHQQLLTEKKLFCHCPAGQYSDVYHAEILRHMRPTLSELGEYDGTALMEFKTKKDIIYRINRKNVCTYEMDDTPPFLINEQALDIAIEIGMMMDANIVDEMHIARKQYLDGSIPTGFQRTAIVSVGGSLPYKDRTINLIQMSIEEDSCREVSDIGHRRVYLADRLGMPLVETVTAPEMKTPVEVAEVCEIVRRVCRSTSHVRTGMGAGREDVNVSVDGGTRIEIKGVPKIKSIPLLTYNEAMRQWNLLKLREELKNRGITPETFEAKIDDVTRFVNKTHYKPVFDAIAEGKVVKCVTLKGFKDLLKWQTQTDTYFSREISDRVRVIACLTTQPNIIHSDSHEVTLSTSEGQKIRKFVGANPEDTLVIVWGSEMDATTAANEIVIRAKEATVGIPSETRQALWDGTNGFERILPGANRMYPDTDLPPKKITEERLARLTAALPEKYWIRENWYKELNVPVDLIKDLSTSIFGNIFKIAVSEMGISPKLASTVLIQFPKRLKKMRLNVDILTEDIFHNIFSAYKNNKLSKDGILYLLVRICKSGEYKEDYLSPLATEQDLKNKVKEKIFRFENKKLYNDDNKKVLMIGMVMRDLRGRINGKQVAEYINNNIN